MFDPNTERVAITVSEAATSTGLKPGAIYRSIRKGEIEVTRLGGRILILFEPFKKKFGL
ncbi:MAG: helix-turn-helix domain-containing protein [Mycobacterium sp.]|nr:helix-turn-helix domain-containing protein [Mycobacterium sp.]